MCRRGGQRGGGIRVSAAPHEPFQDDPELVSSLDRWLWAGVVVFLVLVLSFPLYYQLEGSRRDAALAARKRALVNTGQTLWIADCAACHGDHGQGVTAPALNSKEFLQSVSDDQMHHIIQSGVPGSPMPAWWDQFGGPLTDDEISAIVAYLRSWEKNAPSRPDWRNPTAS
jgi:mono/diheme cytochrome c family protein